MKRRITKKMKDAFAKRVFTPTHLNDQNIEHQGLAKKCEICFKEKWPDGISFGFNVGQGGRG